MVLTSRPHTGKHCVACTCARRSRRVRARAAGGDDPGREGPGAARPARHVGAGHLLVRGQRLRHDLSRDHGERGVPRSGAGGGGVFGGGAAAEDFRLRGRESTLFKMELAALIRALSREYAE